MDREGKIKHKDFIDAVPIMPVKTHCGLWA